MKFDLNPEICFLWCGTFVAPSCEWIHDTRICDSYELFYVTAGTLYIADDTADYTVRTGEYLLTPPCQNQHGWKNSQCSFYWFHFSCGQSGEYFPPSGKYTDLERIKKYYSLLYLNNGNRYIGGSLLCALLLELSKSNLPPQETSSVLCHSIKEYIKLNSPNYLKVSLIAEQFNYNERYLSSLFKKETGTTLKQSITDEIISRAKHLLTNTSISIGQIGTNLGYSDVHNFSHAFRKATGHSPREYRKNSPS